jgi:hypothetical protein
MTPGMIQCFVRPGLEWDDPTGDLHGSAGDGRLGSDCVDQCEEAHDTQGGDRQHNEHNEDDEEAYAEVKKMSLVPAIRGFAGEAGKIFDERLAADERRLQDQLHRQHLARILEQPY